MEENYNEQIDNNPLENVDEPQQENLIPYNQEEIEPPLENEEPNQQNSLYINNYYGNNNQEEINIQNEENNQINNEQIEDINKEPEENVPVEEEQNKGEEEKDISNNNQQPLEELEPKEENINKLEEPYNLSVPVEGESQKPLSKDDDINNIENENIDENNNKNIINESPCQQNQYEENDSENTEKKESKRKETIVEKLKNPKYEKVRQLMEETNKKILETIKEKNSSGLLKSLVSKEKCRFCYDGFDLDLTYITSRIIAMGLPSVSFEGLYRNSMTDVQNFFNQRHPAHYKVYNLCDDKTYPHQTFYKQGTYPFPDHQPPPLNTIITFCRDAEKFLKENEENVVAIHCVAGKGRTGTFVCCLLLFMKIFDTADECQTFYGAQRMSNGKGVTMPSQIRYIGYFEYALKNKIQFPLKSRSVRIKRVRMYTIPTYSLRGNCTPTFSINSSNMKKTYQYWEEANAKKETYESNVPFVDFNLNKILAVDGDVKFTFLHIGFLGKKDKMFYFWFNTYFLPENGIFTITKDKIDDACKDKECKNFSKDLKIEIEFISL